MILTRPLVCFDIESTGVNPATDRIVELALLLYPSGAEFEPGKCFEVCYRFNPGFEMSEEVVAIHGITNEQLADEPAFSVMAEEILNMVSDCDLAGFNHTNFDIPILWEEFNRCGLKWDLSKVNIIDAGSLFKKREPRTLSAAVKFYLGKDHGDAHSAAADCLATAELLHAQMQHYEDLRSLDASALAKAASLDDEERVDLAGKIVKRKPDGVPCYAFGKHKGRPVTEERGFAYWMLDKDFSEETKCHLRRILDINNSSPFKS